MHLLSYGFVSFLWEREKNNEFSALFVYLLWWTWFECGDLSLPLSLYICDCLDFPKVANDLRALFFPKTFDKKNAIWSPVVFNGKHSTTNHFTRNTDREKGKRLDSRRIKCKTRTTSTIKYMVWNESYIIPSKICDSFSLPLFLILGENLFESVDSKRHKCI